MKNKLLIHHAKAKISNIEMSEYDILDISKFHPCKSFFTENKITGENYSEILIISGLETVKYIREVIKKIDQLLSLNGKIIINYFIKNNSIYGGGKHCYIRPFSFLMYEFSVCLGRRYELINKTEHTDIMHLEFVKKKHTLPNDDSIDKWSFGIISDGKKNERIIKTIKQIVKFGIPHFEIIICGPDPNYKDNLGFLRIISDADIRSNLRALITIKKNRIVNNAKYNNLVILHDRISFSDNWYEKMRLYGNYFEFMTNVILDETTKKRRVQDWMYYRGEFADYRNNKGGSMHYNKWSPYVYVDGGLLICKKHLITRIGYNENLHWGEAEDLDISRRLFATGFMINLYRDAEAYSQTHRHPGSFVKFDFYVKAKLILYQILLPINKYISYLKQNIDYKTYLKNILNY